MALSTTVRMCVLPVAVVIMLGVTTAEAAEEQGWVTNSLTVGITKKAFAKVGQESRYADAVYIGDSFLNNWAVALGYKLPATTYLSIGYKREVAGDDSFRLHENRMILEGGWKANIVTNTAFDTRLRLEDRRWEETQKIDNLRYRVRFRFIYRLKVAELDLKPFIADELFGDDLTPSDNIFNRNRFYVGTKIPVGSKVDLLGSYLRQDTQVVVLDEWITIHALVIGIDIKI
jgi:hypothetical protein